MWASFKAHVGLISLALQENQNISRAPTLSSITVMLDIQQIDVGSMYWFDRSLLDQSVSNASGLLSTGELREANDTAHRACVLAPAQLSGTVWYLNSADHLLRKHHLLSCGGFQPHPRACFRSEKMEVKQVPSHYLSKGSETGKVDVAYVWEGTVEKLTTGALIWLKVLL